jgi:hypothetical protein
LALGADKRDFSAYGFNAGAGHGAGWYEVGRTIVFYPDRVIKFDSIANFTICVTSTATWEPYLSTPKALGDAFPYDDAPC